MPSSRTSLPQNRRITAGGDIGFTKSDRSHGFATSTVLELEQSKQAVTLLGSKQILELNRRAEKTALYSFHIVFDNLISWRGQHFGRTPPSHQFCHFCF
jgi:hypothetical protein